MPATDVDDTLAFLIGTWSLERTLDDRRTGRLGSFTGTAVVAPVDRDGGSALEQARYEETGTLRLGTYEGPARRELVLARAGGGVQVLFSDGRPFFHLELRAGRCRAEHPCRADLYEIGFELGGPDLIRERWRVRGPSKAYEALTTWRRR